MSLHLNQEKTCQEYMNASRHTGIIIQIILVYIITRAVNQLKYVFAVNCMIVPS